MTKFVELKQRCRSAGISLAELCRQTNIERKTLQPWKDKNPSSIEKLVKLENKLMEIESRIKV